MLRVPALSPRFADTRAVTDAIDCFLAGQDPYTVRSFDPWHRVLDYPPIWLDLRYLGVTSRSSDLAGVILAVMLVGALLLLLRATRWVSAVAIFFAVLSVPVLLAVERGNTDIVIFSLLVFGFFLIGPLKDGVRSFFTALLIVLLTVLKIYPIASVAVLIRNRKGVLTALLTGILSIAALILTSGRRIPQLLSNVLAFVHGSFGAYPFFVVTTSHMPQFFRAKIVHPHLMAFVGAATLAALSAVAGGVYSDRLDRFLPRLDFERARGCIATACLAIFCFVFVGGSNVDYRLIFLLGVLGYLVEDLDAGKGLRSLPASIVLVLFLWIPWRYLLLSQLLGGLIFTIACAWLGSTLLARLRTRDVRHSGFRPCEVSS